MISQMFSFAFGALTVAGVVTVVDAAAQKRPGAGISGKEMAGPISPEYNGRSDFGRIMEWDPKGPHYWLAEIQNGNIKVLDDYSDAEKCWKATFTEGPKDGPWRVCIPLDEPAEEFLARVIYLHVN